MPTLRYLRWLIIPMFLVLMVAAGSSQTSPLLSQWETYTLSDGLPSNKVLCVTVDGERVWAGTDNGLALIERGAVQKVFGEQDGLTNRVVTGIAVSPESGDVWVSTFGGVSQFSGGVFRNYTSLTSGLANDVVFGIALQGRYVWATTAAGMSRLNTYDGEWSIFTERNSPTEAPFPTSIAVVAQNVYFGGVAGRVVKYDALTGQWGAYPNPNVNPDQRIREERDGQGSQFASSIATWGSKVVWVGTRFGLRSYDGHRSHSYRYGAPGLASDIVNSVTGSKTGVWIGTEQGLNFFNAEQNAWTTYRRDGDHGQIETWTRGISSKLETPTFPVQNKILNVAVHGNHVWVATPDGLSHGMPKCNMASACYKKNDSPKHVRIAGASREAMGLQSLVLDSTKANTPMEPRVGGMPGVHIGFFGPTENSPESRYGLEMLHGAQLAVEEANAKGGYTSSDTGIQRRYVLDVHNDSAQWGASTALPIKMAMEENVVGVVGLVDSYAARNLLRIASVLEFPVVDTGTTDPEVTATSVSWLVHNFPDDRQQSAALVNYIFGGANLTRIAVLRSNSSYAQIGTREFLHAARAAGHEPVAVLEFNSKSEDLSAKIRQLQVLGADGIVIWADPEEAGSVLQQMRAAKLVLPAFGPSRLANSRLVKTAGPAAEGLVVASALDAVRMGTEWHRFEQNYLRLYGVGPGEYAYYAYDGTNMLIAAIQKAGLSRVQVMSALRESRSRTYQSVSGEVKFDDLLNNASPVTLLRVVGGEFIEQGGRN